MIQLSVSEKFHARVSHHLRTDADLRCVPLPPSDAIPHEHRSSRVLLHWGLSLEQLARCATELPAIEWIHTFWAGTERIVPIARRFAGPPRFSDSRGAYSIPIAEHALGLLLGLARGLHRHRDGRGGARWEPCEGGEIHGRRALILGAGGIGLRIGELLMAFGVAVEGIRRRVEVGAAPFPIHPATALDDRLPGADILVAALPESAATVGLLDERRLRLLPAGALLVNVGRGSLVDETALVRVLEEGRLAGVGLDVTVAEPLPAESPLWRFAEVWITPHCSGLSPAMNGRRLDLFETNLAAFRRGEPLSNETLLREE